MIHINEAYLHILDANNETKVYSENPMQIEGEIYEYIDKHITGFFDQLDIVSMEIDEGAGIASLISQADDFKGMTLEISDLFAAVMTKTEDIKACDLMCILFTLEDQEFIGVLKLNFRTSYAHYVDVEENIITNRIIRQVTTLPYKSQKVEEGFVINLAQMKIYIRDKSVTIDGNKTKYITEEILKMKPALTTKRSIDVMAKAAEKVIEKYHDEDYVKKAKIKDFINEQIDEHSVLDARTVALQCFETESEREAYTAELASKGIDQTPIVVNEEQKKKLKRTQKIKTASGVEITLPYEYIKREENLVIENNPDGTITIKLNNLGEIL